MKKQGLLTAIGEGYSHWIDVLAGISPERMVEPNAVGDWSVKDVVAHIAADHRWLAAQIEAATKGRRPTANACFGQDDPPPPEYDIANNQDRNDWNVLRHRDWTLEAVTGEAGFAYGWLLEMIEELPESDLTATYTIASYDNINHVRPANDDDDFRFPLWSLISNYTIEHYPSHVRDVQNWLDHGS